MCQPRLIRGTGRLGIQRNAYNRKVRSVNHHPGRDIRVRTVDVWKCCSPPGVNQHKHWIKWIQIFIQTIILGVQIKYPPCLRVICEQICDIFRRHFSVSELSIQTSADAGWTFIRMTLYHIHTKTRPEFKLSCYSIYSELFFHLFKASERRSVVSVYSHRFSSRSSGTRLWQQIKKCVHFCVFLRGMFNRFSSFSF